MRICREQVYRSTVVGKAPAFESIDAKEYVRRAGICDGLQIDRYPLMKCTDANATSRVFRHLAITSLAGSAPALARFISRTSTP